ncbi:DUF6483 family protein [Paenibacillus mucilaginosus]|uniref:Uncharacterized protein n=1 Tax=Paenibacillus mucilaginosus (strain KNP414) TaxID=1036673 RepID=F8FP61_PAEMK|nr:DUF6483 family protein [Paenibacillus mucilaginosus]AEI45840.1 hypothetical protein KNP414_07330 [Paenibacillus mucilaginosus KNP414]MCG7214981.1 DUF6483 family protein [Paenibacillus mucilaginosus]WDM27208.1 hypothetical protein KCX80_33245 [Paenibacillus mucilaginosus]
MYQRDYILRMIEQAGVMVGRVMHLARNKRMQEAVELLQQAMKEMLGLGSKLIGALSVKDLIALLSKDGELDSAKVLALGDLMKAQSELQREGGEEAAAQRTAKKSLELLLIGREYDARGELREEFNRRIEEALDITGRAGLNEGILSRIVGYYEEQGSYAWAEDALFYRLEVLQGAGRELERRAVVEEGIRMYERWVLLEDATLQAGGLSAEEAEEGLRTLRQLKITQSQ